MWTKQNYYKQGKEHIILSDLQSIITAQRNKILYINRDLSPIEAKLAYQKRVKRCERLILCQNLRSAASNTPDCELMPSVYTTAVGLNDHADIVILCMFYCILSCLACQHRRKLPPNSGGFMALSFPSPPLSCLFLPTLPLPSPLIRSRAPKSSWGSGERVIWWQQF